MVGEREREMRGVGKAYFIILVAMYDLGRGLYLGGRFVMCYASYDQYIRLHSDAPFFFVNLGSEPRTLSLLPWVSGSN